MRCPPMRAMANRPTMVQNRAYDPTCDMAPVSKLALSPLLLIEIPAGGLRNGSAELQAVFGRAFIKILLGRIRNADERYLNLLRTTGG